MIFIFSLLRAVSIAATCAHLLGGMICLLSAASAHDVGLLA